MGLTGLIKAQIKLIFVSGLVFLSLPFLPIPLQFEPVPYSVNPPEFKGALALNTIIDEKSKILFQNQLLGPECFAQQDNFIYTGTKLGDIWRFNADTLALEKVVNTGNDCKGLHDQENCGRVLGLRFSKEGDLYAIDAFKGLLKINVKTKKIETLVKNGDYVGSQRLIFGDDLVIDDETGIIYYTQGSTKWGLHQVVLITLEHDNSGRILSYDTKSKKSAVVLDKLDFPNGITISHDQQNLLFAEFNNHRIMKFGLRGAAKGKLSVFSDRLPGGPDNLKPSPSGGYWVAFESSRSVFQSGDVIAPYPLLAKAVVRMNWLIGQALRKIQELVKHPALDNYISDFEYCNIMMHVVPKAGVVAELDSNGKVIRSLHSTAISLFSDAFEYNKHLYIGSVYHPFMLRVNLK